MITRSFDGDRLNELVNDLSIRPYVGGEGPLDLSEAAENEINYFLLGDHGGFFCNWTAPETYEVHTFILPSGRGAWGFSFAKAGRDYMAGIGASHLWTRVAKTDRHTRIFTLRAGFRPCGEQFLDFGQGPIAYELFDWRT